VRCAHVSASLQQIVAMKARELLGAAAAAAANAAAVVLTDGRPCWLPRTSLALHRKEEACS